MKQIIFLALITLYFNIAYAQEFNKGIPTHHIEPVKILGGPVVSPAYIDSSLFARYINWNLQPDSLPTFIKPAKGDTIEIWYVVSKEGKISSARSRDNKKNELNNFISQKFMSCPYQWTPAYQNGRAVNAYFKMRIVF